MATTLSVRPHRAILYGGELSGLPRRRRVDRTSQNGKVSLSFKNRRRLLLGVVSAGSRADESAPFDEMSVEKALKLLGVSEGASFDDILRAKNSILAGCKDDQNAISQVSILLFITILFELMASSYFFCLIAVALSWNVCW